VKTGGSPDRGRPTTSPARDGNVRGYEPATVEKMVASADYRLFCEGRLAAPYALMAWLRRNDPVHFSPVLKAWVLTRYDDVFEGLLGRRLRNDRISASMSALPPEMRASCAPLGDHISNWLGFTDPPKHTRLRGLVRPTFTPALAKKLTARITAITDELIDAMAGDAEPDLVSEFASPLPARVICEILGIPEDQTGSFHDWSDAMVAFTGHIGPTLVDIAPRAMDSYLALEDFFETLVAERSRCPADDLVSQLTADETKGDLSRQELIGLSVFALVAGHETTASLLATGLLILLDDDDLKRRLTNNPELYPAAVEEFLRLESPIQFSPRLAGTTFELRGKTIQEGDAVILHLGAANRDPERFADPDVLDLARPDNKHLAFAWGAHFCLGAPLARAEAAVAFARILERMPDIHRLGDEVSWRENMTIRAPTELRVEMGSIRST
jgi:pimeloyl-[acyl-carrier protein] synthase